MHDNIAAHVHAAVVSVCHAPRAGERKKGDLSDLWVHKFKSQGQGQGQGQLYLLGYSLDENVRLLYLEAIGPHENFDRDLKRS